jgi:hypothetical protein
LLEIRNDFTTKRHLLQLHAFPFYDGLQKPIVIISVRNKPDNLCRISRCSYPPSRQLYGVTRLTLFQKHTLHGCLLGSGMRSLNTTPILTLVQWEGSGSRHIFVSTGQPGIYACALYCRERHSRAFQYCKLPIPFPKD